MKEFHGSATIVVDASADAVFDLITDVNRLPEWNAAIGEVVDRPATLAPGVEWTIKMAPPRMPTWFSVSRVDLLDPAARRFAYETRNADGNPSHTEWAWAVSDAGGGRAEVAVAWHAYLKTADRRLLGGPLRKRQLAREVPTSLAALAACLHRAQPRP